MLRSTILVIVAGLSCMVSSSAAQGITALVGTTSDKSGAVVSGADITVTDSGTGSQRSAKTDASGNYIVENLKPGVYEVSAAKSGFTTKKITGIVLQVSHRGRVDIQLEVGSVLDQVEVRGDVQLLETNTSSVGKVIEAKDITNLPLNGRKFLQLASLVPGVIRTSNPPYLETTGGSVSANGMSNMSNNTMVDGIMNQETGAGRMTFSPSVDLIQEFKIQTNTYDAEYGRTGGSQIEVVTKRGSNTYHGAAYEFIRNSALDARPYFQRTELPPFRRNQFGATFGGRIPFLKKDYFYFSYEGLRSAQGITAVLTLPQPALRGGNFSSVSTVIYDPATYDPNTGQRQPFPGNIIPQNRLNPTTLYFMNRFFPVPATNALVNNYVSNPNSINNSDQLSIRYDRDFSEHDLVTFRYTRNKIFLLLPRGDSGVATPLPGLGELIDLYGQNHLLRYNHIFSPTTMNVLTVGYSQYNQQRHPETTGKNIIPDSGMKGVNDDQAGIPQFTITGYSSLTDNFVSPISQPFDNYILNDTFSKVWGKHALRFGGGLLYNRTPSKLNLFDRGTLNFRATYTTPSLNSTAGNQYNALAEFLLGLPTTTSIWLNPVNTDWRSHTEYGFIQDDWTVTRSFSVNLGLRYDVYQRAYDTQNRESAFDLGTMRQVYPGSVPNLPGVPAKSATAESLGYSRTLQFPTTYNNFSPRVGFAWRLPRMKGTVLRGGAGVFYSWTVIDSATNLALGPPWVPNTSVTCNKDIPCTTATNPFSSTIPTFPSNNLANKTNRTPYVVQYSLGVQHEFTPRLSLEMGYVGNASFKNYLRIFPNQPVPGPGTVQSRRPYPTLGDVNGYYTVGKAHYDSLQTALRKTFDSTGLVVLASYTWSHALGNSISGPQINEGPSGGIRDYRNINAEYGNTQYDTRHNFALSSTYQLPFGKGKRFGSSWGTLPDKILGGWSLDTIISARSGNWLTPSDIVDVSNSGGSRPDRIDDPNGFGHSNKEAAIAKWFDTSAFVRAPQFTFGNSGTGIILGPGFFNLDLGLGKRFAVNERVGLQFRSEFFNAFNHTNLGNPGTAFGSASFGVISSTQGDARSIQFGLRVDF
jgi:hypothetical protein